MNTWWQKLWIFLFVAVIAVVLVWGSLHIYVWTTIHYARWMGWLR